MATSSLNQSLDDLDVDLVCTSVLTNLPPSSILTMSRLNKKCVLPNEYFGCFAKDDNFFRWHGLFVIKDNLLWKTLCLKFGLKDLPEGQTSWKNQYLSMRKKVLIACISGSRSMYFYTYCLNA